MDMEVAALALQLPSAVAREAAALKGAVIEAMVKEGRPPDMAGAAAAKATGVHVGEKWDAASIVVNVQREKRACMRHMYGQTKLVIIDEAAKVDADQLDVLNEVAKQMTGVPIDYRLRVI